MTQSGKEEETVAGLAFVRAKLPVWCAYCFLKISILLDFFSE